MQCDKWLGITMIMVMWFLSLSFSRPFYPSHLWQCDSSSVRLLCAECVQWGGWRRSTSHRWNTIPFLTLLQRIWHLILHDATAVRNWSQFPGAMPVAFSRRFFSTVHSLLFAQLVVSAPAQHFYWRNICSSLCLFLCEFSVMNPSALLQAALSCFAADTWQIQQEEYHCSEKSDGVRYMMLVRVDDNSRRIFLIDRKCTVYSLSHHFEFLAAAFQYVGDAVVSFPSR